MKQALLTALAVSLLLTVALETVFFILTRKWFASKRDKKDILLVVLVNVLTNPVVVLLYWLTALYTEWDPRIAFIPLELFAVGTEGYFYKKYAVGFRRPYLFSVAANMVSFWTGVFLQRLI